MEDRYVNDVEAAKILSVSPQSMRNWRHMRKGPPYTKRGRMVRYSLKELMNYMDGGRITPENDNIG
jgi:hypothetical protein